MLAGPEGGNCLLLGSCKPPRVCGEVLEGEVHQLTETRSDPGCVVTISGVNIILLWLDGGIIICIMYSTRQKKANEQIKFAHQSLDG